MNMRVKLHSLKMCTSLSSLVNEHLKAIHRAFNVETYIKLMPTERKITYLLYIFYNLRVFVVKSAKISTILCPFAEKKNVLP